MKKYSVIPLLLGVIFFSTTIFAQTLSTGVIGKLYTKAEANTLYGPVLKSVTLKTSSLSTFLAKTPDYVMFNILKGQLYVLNSERSVLSGPTASISTAQQMRLFSTSIVNKLIQEGGSATTTVELRANSIITVTNGDETLEQAVTCPPVCP